MSDLPGSSSSSSEASNEDGWVDADQELEEPPAIISLLDDRVFADAVSMVSYCKERFAFDFLAIRDRLSLDFYGCIKLINFVRQRVHEGVALPAEIQPSDLEDEHYLKPVLDDDAFIISLDELPSATGVAVPAVGGAAGQELDKQPDKEAATESLASRNAELQAELGRLVRQFADYRLAVQRTLDQRWGDGEDDALVQGGASTAGSPNQQHEDQQQQQGGKGKGKGRENSKPVDDDSKYYWESYASNEIHETMLKDTVRTDAYRDFIYNNKDMFRGKVVLDIGCGTGILSMFCAKAGARLVMAVDNSNIIDKARENVFNNGLSGQITLLKGKIEDVKLPVEQVDVIVSEWMGYALLYEAMLPSVIWARDRYLKADGLLVPSHASLWIAPVADDDYVSDHVAFWQDVYGFDMKAMQEGIFADARVEHMLETSACGSAQMFRLLDLHTVGKEDLVFEAEWKSVVKMAPTEAGGGGAGGEAGAETKSGRNPEVEKLDGFLVWFDMFFGTSRTQEITPPDRTAVSWADGSEDRVAFTTGPYGRQTHWKQTLLLMGQDRPHLALAQGQCLSGKVAFSIPEDNPRGLILKVSWTLSGGEGVDAAETVMATMATQSWEMK